MPTAAELAVRPEIRHWIGAVGERLGLSLLILETSQYHDVFGLRLQLDGDIDLNRDPRIPALLRGASNVSGARGVILESRSGTRLSFVPGMGVFMKVGDRSFGDETVTDASSLEGLELTKRPFGLRRCLMRTRTMCGSRDWRTGSRSLNAERTPLVAEILEVTTLRPAPGSPQRTSSPRTRTSTSTSSVSPASSGVASSSARTGRSSTSLPTTALLTHGPGRVGSPARWPNHPCTQRSTTRRSTGR